MPEVREAQISYDVCLCVGSWKNDMDELIYETEIDSQT